MNGKILILVVEDEAGISTYISTVLNSNDYAVLRTDKGEEAVSLAASHHPDLMLLDLGLPDIDGIEVLRRVREWSSMPIVVVSARGHEREKVEALDLGADDYITKPFGTSELLARIRTAIRHNRQGEGSPAQEKISIGQMSIDYEKRTVTVEGREIHFTPIEYKIITLLARHAGKVLTHDFLIREIWGPYTNENQTLRVNMANIRRKIEANPAEPKYIVTEVGVGYRMKDGDHL
ncbi:MULTISPECIES: response regulator [Paenibacillus]|uniref:XRE family transcriptional regulator n=1 Tax=Paenibacillus durus ATCC 35681 TaxID=1333534 RepID=A0A0F7CJK1_PAEDU|nr:MULTISPECIES: response regulator transcription factor [Paenibacillus]AKG36241.1 XRE family transcriptional regulator [Paenibacillus durus ATCC 35681]